MGNSLLISSNAAPVGISTASTSFFCPPGGVLNPFAVASAVFAVPFPVAGTISKLAINISSNGRGTTTIVRTNINGSPGSCSINIGAGLTGVFTDLINSDSINPGDVVTFEILLGTGTGTFNPTGAISAIFNSSQCVVPAVCSPNSASGFSTVSAVRYMSLSGDMNAWSATEAPTQNKLPNCTLSNAFAYLMASVSVTTNFNARKNVGALNNTISVTAATTGIFKDTTHTDILSANSLIDFQWNYTSGSNGTLSMVGAWLTSAINTPFYIGNNRQTATAITAGTHFGVLNGQPAISTTESNCQSYIGYPFKWSGLSITVNSNTLTSDMIVKSRVNGADGKQTITIPAGTTGTFTDTTNADILSAGALINIEFTGGTSGTATAYDISSLFTDTSGFVPPGQANKGKGAPGKSGDKGNHGGNNPPPVSSPPVEYTGYQLSFPNIRYNNKPVGYIRHVSIGSERQDHLPLLGVT